MGQTTQVKRASHLAGMNNLNLSIYYDAYPPDVSKVSHSNNISILKAIFQQRKLSQRSSVKKFAQRNSVCKQSPEFWSSFTCNLKCLPLMPAKKREKKENTPKFFIL